MSPSEMTDERTAELTAEAADEYTSELRSGKSPDVETYVRRYPEIGDVIRDLFPALEAVERFDQTNVPRIPDHLGDFRLLKEIGRGGMGVVYLAEQVSLRRTVAVKVLPLAGLLDDRQRIRFENEAAAAATLCHPNIVPVYAVGVEQGIHFYAMHWVRGQSLDALIVESSHAQSPTSLDERLTYREIARLGIQAALALDHAHAHGIVHRDIKPGNLLLDDSGKLWVADFGLAQMEANASITLSGDLLGTLRYMSPEQATGKHALLDQRTDIYSLGATLYELLTGHRAHDDTDRNRLALKVANERPVAPRKYDPKIPLPLETILLKSLEKIPDDRYQSASELAEDLGRFLDSKSILARPVGRLQRIGNWMRRHPLTVVASISFLLLGLVALGATAFLFNAQRQQTIAALASEREQRERGDAHLQRARETISKALMRELQHMGDAPSMTETQRRLFEEIVAYYESLPEADLGSPEVRADAGFAWSRLALAYDRLGKSDESLAARTRAVDLFQRLTDEYPSQGKFRCELVANMIATGDAQRRENRLTDALQSYQSAIETQASEETNPSSRWMQQRARARQRMANCYSRLAQPELAEKYYREAIRWFERQKNCEADALQPSVDLAVVESEFAAFLQTGRGDPLALEFYQKARERCMRLLQESPNETEYRALAAGVHNDLALYLRQQGNVKDAGNCFQVAVAQWRTLVDDFPSRPRYRRLLVGGLSNLGGLRHDQGRFDEAERVFREALEASATLVEEFPQIVAHHELHAGNLNNLGHVLNRLDRHAEQREVVAKALTVWQQLAASHPSQPSYRAQLAMGYYAVAQRQRPEAALPLFEAAIDELEELAERYPQVPAYQARLTTCLNALGISRTRVNDYERATECLEESLRVARQLTVRWPGNPDYHGKVVRRLRHLGNLYLQQGDYDGAIAAYEEALMEQDRLAAAFPEYSRPMYISPAASLHAALATAILRRTNRIDQDVELPDQAKEHFARAAELSNDQFLAMARQIAPVIGRDASRHLLAAYREHNGIEAGDKAIRP